MTNNLCFIKNETSEDFLNILEIYHSESFNFKTWEVN